MRLFSFCLVAASSVCVFAAPYAAPTDGTDGGPSILPYEDWPAEGTWVGIDKTESIDVVEEPSFYNGTFQGPVDKAGPDYKAGPPEMAGAQQKAAFLEIRLAGGKQNIGFYRGIHMYHEMQRCLGRLCGMASGVGRDVCDPAPCKIDHVAFNKDGRINYGSYLEVRVLEAAFPERETFQWKDLQRDALLEVVAYAYQAQTERVSDNCHQVADSVYVICNVGEFVEAYVGDTPGAGFIKVGLINNLRNPSGKHDCQASEIPIHDYIRSNIQYKLTYALSNFHWVNRVYCACGWWC